MLRFLFGFLLGIMLSNTFGVKAQELESEHPHAHEFTVKEIIDVLGEYDIRHIDEVPFAPPAYGVTTFESQVPTIWIFNTADMRSKKSTLLHEFYHVHCHNVGVECSEPNVRAVEEIEFQRIFGVQ